MSRKAMEKIESKVKRLVSQYYDHVVRLDDPEEIEACFAFIDYLEGNNGATEIGDKMMARQEQLRLDAGAKYDIGWELFYNKTDSIIVGHIYEPGMGDLEHWGYASSDADGEHIIEEGEVVKAIAPKD